MNKSQSAFTKYGTQLTGISGVCALGDGLTKTVTPAVLALAYAVLSANNVSDATAKIQNNLGGTAEDEKIAGVANDVFKDGWGDSLDSVTTSLLEVKEQVREPS